MKKLSLLIFVLVSAYAGSDIQARNLSAFLSYSSFNSPEGPYIETYLTIAANSVQFVKKENGMFFFTL